MDAAVDVAWHAMTADDVAKRLDTSTKRGLNAAEASSRLRKYGPNRLPRAGVCFRDAKRGGKMSWSLFAKQTPPGQILRYDLEERAVHWVVGLTCVYLILTGLGLHAPSLFWLMGVLGGGQVARIWHPIIGMLYFVSLIWMWKLWHKDLKPSEPDTAWMKSVLFYMANRDEHLPATGRWNPGQKMFFWMMLLAGFALVLSGTILWFPERVPWSWKWVRFLAILVHSAAAVASIGGLLLHIYMGAVFVRGGFEQMVTGHVSREWAEHHHHLWYI